MISLFSWRFSSADSNLLHFGFLWNLLILSTFSVRVSKLFPEPHVLSRGPPYGWRLEFWVRGKGGFTLRWASFWPGMRLRKAEETQECGSLGQLPAQPASVWTPQQVAGCTLLGKVGLSPKGLGQSYRDWEDHLSSLHQIGFMKWCDGKGMEPGVKTLWVSIPSLSQILCWFWAKPPSQKALVSLCLKWGIRANSDDFYFFFLSPRTSYSHQPH